MHDVMVAGSFLLMILSPCLVALRTGIGSESHTEEKIYGE
jgi:hypothetical protein